MTKISLAVGRWHSVSLAFVRIVKDFISRHVKPSATGLYSLQQHHSYCAERNGECGKLLPDFDVIFER